MNIGSRYEKMKQDRQPYLDRARKVAKLTIPALIPESGANSATPFDTPYQSVGSRGVKHLANKLITALFPPSEPFFRLVASMELLETLNEDKAKVDAGLSIIEQTVSENVDERAMRVPLAESALHLLVAGNCLLYLPRKAERMRMFRLDRYVVRRDPMGTILEVITHETVSPDTLGPEIVTLVRSQETSNMGVPPGVEEKAWDLYTRCVLSEGKWVVDQEVRGIILPESRRTYPKKMCPYIPLRMTAVDGEDYGRGYVEDFYGDLHSLEQLTKAIVEGSKAAARILVMVAPNGTTRLSDIQNAPNGGAVYGNAQDISMLQMNKYADFQVAQRTAEDIKQRLEQSFLLHSAIQRNGDRVTAEEIRYMAQELETQMGGLYSVLSQELQLPLVRLIMDDLQTAKRIPVLPPEIRPTIVTGIDGLGRGQDMGKWQAFFASAGAVPPELWIQEANVKEIISRLMNAAGINTMGVWKSDEDKAAEQEASLGQEQASAGIQADAKVAAQVPSPMGGE